MSRDSAVYNPGDNQSRSLHEDIQSPMQNQPQTPNEYDGDPKAAAIDHKAVRQMSASESVIEGQQWLRNSNRKGTHSHEDKMQTRLLRHDAIFRRPHCLQYFHPNDSRSLIPPERLLSHPLSHESRNSSVSSGSQDERSTDNYLKQLMRLDLFIDLVWVGIIANLSGTYGEQAFADSGVSIGEAVGEFTLLFIPIWRVWDYLREYGSNFYKDDVIQRFFMIWILMLAVLYGVNAPFAFVPDSGTNSLQVLICIYLVTRASLLAAHLIQCVCMPFLRRLFVFQLVTTIIGSGLWIAAIWVHYPYKIVLLVLANFIEHPIALFMSSPLSDRLLSGGWERSQNISHYVERIQGFFIIILGEGVFRLIEGSPSGVGLNPATGTILLALLLYYVLHWLYFNGDQSKQFVHALRRKWYKPFLWKTLHLTLFHALLILAASILFLVQHTNATADVIPGITERATSETTTPEEEARFTNSALWSASASLGVVLFTMTSIALLDRPLDKPKTLIINSRLIRLAPRIPAIVVICCLPLIDGLSGGAWTGGASAILYIVYTWEWIASLEKGFTLYEKKPEDKEDQEQTEQDLE